MKPYYEQDGITIYHGDCRDVVPVYGAVVDHLITDPPYSDHVHTKSMRGASGWKGPIAEVRDLGFSALTDDLRNDVCDWTTETVRRWALIFSDVESAGAWGEALIYHGLDRVRIGAWIKVGGAPQFTGDRPAVGFEAITIAHRPGKKRWNGGGKAGVWSVPIVLNRGASATEYRCHTTQKPEELMSQLMTDFTDPGDVIADWFMGSGTTLVAAKRLGRKAIGIEREEKYCEIAAKRLAQGALPMEFSA